SGCGCVHHEPGLFPLVLARGAFAKAQGKPPTIAARVRASTPSVAAKIFGWSRKGRSATRVGAAEYHAPRCDADSACCGRATRRNSGRNFDLGEKMASVNKVILIGNL